MAPVQAEKLDFSDAEAELIKCGKGFQRRMGDLKAWEQAKMEAALMEHARREQEYHAVHNLQWEIFSGY